MRFPDFNDDWKETSLGELLSFYPTNSYSWDQLDYETGAIYNVHYGLIHKGLPTICSPNKVKLPLIKEDLDVNKYMMCKAGDLIIADASEDTNDVGKAIEIIECENREVVAGLHTIHARSKQDTTSLGFKGYLFASKNLKGQIRQVAQGTKVYSISAKLLSPLIISLPSLAEQKKIADFLSLIDERIQSCSEAIDQRKSFRNGIIKLIVGNLKADRISLKECVICNTSSLSESKLDLTGIPVYGASGIVGYTSAVEADQCAILIIKDGSGVGRLKYIDSPHSFTATLNSLKSKKSNVNLRYVYYCMSILDLKKYSTGTGIPHIYFKDYGLESIPLPTLEEQKKIADFLSLIDEQIEVEELLLKKYEEQKKYLLRNMFV